jgi:FlaA1/EpsC-like NDP-sugar epimerase
MGKRMRAVRDLAVEPGRLHPALRLAGDAARITASYLIVLILRFDGSVPDLYWGRFFWFMPVAIAVHLVALRLWHVYDEIWTVAGIREARRLVEANCVAIAVLVAIDLAVPHRLPVSVVLLGGFVATAVIGAGRFQGRILSTTRRDQRQSGTRVAILGAGDAGAAIVRSLARETRQGLLPVVALDDQRRLHGLTLLGVPVAGAIEDLPAIAEQYDVHLALLCIPNSPPQLVQRAASAAEQAGITLKIVPAVEEVVRGRSAAAGVRNVRIEDLLGRKQVQTDLAAVRGIIGGRRVLITGAGGSIGSEMARQVASFGPSSLVLLDHDETHLHDAASELTADVELVLADIRDADLMLDVFTSHRPEVVFHAAAHKHVPLLERNPSEAVRTNIIGTANLLDAADAVGTDRFVLISTDKAVAPSSVMGASKAVCEQLTMRASARNDGHYCAVRFGNVLGSRGSVIPTFARQIDKGGPVTVTDPTMTRFFMSTPEAVQLVLQAAAITGGGEIFMLEMGEPVNILGLAERMIRLSGLEVGRDIEIQIVGSRPGEKIHEQLIASDERESPTAHPSIKRVEAAILDEDVVVAAVHELATLAHERDDEKVAASLMRIVGAAAVDPTEEDQTWSSATT